MISRITVVPKVIARLIAIGVPQMIMTFAFLWRISIARATKAKLAGSIVSTNSRYMASDTSCRTGVSPVTVTALLGGMSSSLSVSIVDVHS